MEKIPDVSVWKRGCTRVFKKFNFFTKNFKKNLYVLNRFDTLILKIIFKK
jgi:hypothetical protein